MSLLQACLSTPILKTTKMFPCFRFFLLAASLLASSAYSLRPVQEYQVAIAKVMASYLSPANMEQAKAINSTLLADNVIIRGNAARSPPPRRIALNNLPNADSLCFLSEKLMSRKTMSVAKKERNTSGGSLPTRSRAPRTVPHNYCPTPYHPHFSR